MASWQAHFMSFVLRHTFKPRLARCKDAMQARSVMGGGGLALATMLKLRAEGDALPLAALLFSPLTDLAGTGNSRVTNDKRCAMFFGNGLAFARDLYLGSSGDPHDPLASPLYADLKGLPPLLIHAGANETLRDDSTQFAERARAAGVPVELTVWPAVPHVGQLFHR